MKSVQQVFRVVELLWKLNGAGPTEVAHELDVHKSTAHVYLRSLESVGYAVNRDGTYELSFRFLSTGSRLKYRSRVFQAARDEIGRLARETGELPTLVVEEAGTAVILHQKEGADSLELGTYCGMRTPMHTTASGKAILAHLPHERIAEILGDDVERVTDRTETGTEVLLDELERIREDGFAVDFDRQVVGMGLLAVPILIDGRPIASVAIACPTERLRDESYRTELLRYLKESQNKISIKYRYGQ